MKEIKLTKNAITLVDENAFDFLSQWKWYLHKGSQDRIGYAARTKTIKGKFHIIFMHHVIQPRLKGFETDHINRNTLDNQSVNLRYTTHKENCAHFKHIYKGITSNRYNKNKDKYLKPKGDLWK